MHYSLNGRSCVLQSIESANPLGQPRILSTTNVPLNIVTYNKKNYDDIPKKKIMIRNFLLIRIMIRIGNAKNPYKNKEIR